MVNTSELHGMGSATNEWCSSTDNAIACLRRLYVAVKGKESHRALCGHLEKGVLAGNVLRMLLLLSLIVVAQVLLPENARAAECPKVASSGEALKYLRENQADNSLTTAECFMRSLALLPQSDAPADIDVWRSYLWEGADFLKRMYDAAPPASDARKDYVAMELRSLAAYREKTLARIESHDGNSTARPETLKSDYAKGVNAESNAFWRQSEGKEKGLLELQSFLAELSPVYLLDQTALRWLEANRTCPNWVPAIAKPLPDYASAWCTADCRDHYTTLSDKLTTWWEGIPQAERLQSFKRRIRVEAEVKKFCGS